MNSCLIFLKNLAVCSDPGSLPLLLGSTPTDLEEDQGRHIRERLRQAAEELGSGLSWSVIAFSIGLQVGTISLYELLNPVTGAEKMVLHESPPFIKATAAYMSPPWKPSCEGTPAPQAFLKPGQERPRDRRVTNFFFKKDFLLKYS